MYYREIRCVKEINEDTGKAEKKIIQPSAASLNPSIKIVNDEDEVVFTYSLPFDSYLNVENNQRVELGHILAKLPPRKRENTRYYRRSSAY